MTIFIQVLCDKILVINVCKPSAYEIQDTRGTEIMLHCFHGSGRNRYIVVRTGDFRPSRKEFLFHNPNIRPGHFCFSPYLRKSDSRSPRVARSGHGGLTVGGGGMHSRAGHPRTSRRRGVVGVRLETAAPGSVPAREPCAQPGTQGPDAVVSGTDVPRFNRNR